MNKIMGLDVGTKRIGVALSDYLLITAQPCEMVPRQPEEKAIGRLKQIAAEWNVKTIVIGLPFNMDGTKGEQAQDCIAFGSLLKNDFVVVYEDERLTSFMAEENLRRRSKPYSKHKELIDIESACIILQEYLNRKDKTNDGL